jgi:hypothetical protein
MKQRDTCTISANIFSLGLRQHRRSEMVFHALLIRKGFLTQDQATSPAIPFFSQPQGATSQVEPEGFRFQREESRLIKKITVIKVAFFACGKFRFSILWFSAMDGERIYCEYYRKFFNLRC